MYSPFWWSTQPLPEAEATPTDLDAYDDIPVETSGEDCPPPVEKFADIALHPGLQANIDAAKFVKPTPVQRHSLSIGIARRDVMACAQTGSGKTGGFLGTFGRGKMVPPFDDACFDEANQPGSVVGPVQTAFGWHLIYIQERTAA